MSFQTTTFLQRRLASSASAFSAPLPAQDEALVFHHWNSLCSRRGYLSASEAFLMDGSREMGTCEDGPTLTYSVAPANIGMSDGDGSRIRETKAHFPRRMLDTQKTSDMAWCNTAHNDIQIAKEA